MIYQLVKGISVLVALTLQYKYVIIRLTTLNTIKVVGDPIIGVSFEI